MHARVVRAVLLGLVVAPVPAGAVDLVLEGVRAATPGGDVALRVSSRARFAFDPAAGVLQGSGTFLAEYVLPNQLTRFGHQVEDLRVTAGGELAMRSYECVEGPFGAQYLNASLCGNYRFGPNGLDDGGLVDDEAQGVARTLAGWLPGDLDWDGEVLELMLLPGVEAPAGLFAETALTLRFVPAVDR